jgi:hypothetical protein
MRAAILFLCGSSSMYRFLPPITCLFVLMVATLVSLFLGRADRRSGGAGTLCLEIAIGLYYLRAFSVPPVTARPYQVI